MQYYSKKQMTFPETDDDDVSGPGFVSHGTETIVSRSQWLSAFFADIFIDRWAEEPTVSISHFIWVPL